MSNNWMPYKDGLGETKRINNYDVDRVRLASGGFHYYIHAEKYLGPFRSYAAMAGTLSALPFKRHLTLVRGVR